MSRIVKKTFQIKGMHCVSCAMNIDFDLEDINGVKKAHTNYAKQICEVEYDSGIVTEKDIIASIEKTGYSVEI